MARLADSRRDSVCDKTAARAFTRWRSEIQPDPKQPTMLTLYRERGAAMYGLARSVLRGLADPADAVASALERMWVEGSVSPERLEHLVANEARSLRTKTLRSRRREQPIGLLSDLAEMEEAAADGVRGQVGPGFASSFDSAVRDLPDNERDAFFLTELRGVTDREAAELLGVSRMTANRRSTAAKITIRKELSHSA